MTEADHTPKLLPMLTIEPATLEDWPDIERIYREGILTGQATFQTVEEIPTGDYWFNAKVAGHTFKGIDETGTIVAWTCLSPTSSRPVYRGVCEVSVYVSTSAQGKGIGSIMLGHLVERAEEAGIWTLQSSIFPENEASVHIHKKHGFRILGRREKIAQQYGVWRDTVIMERRSRTIF